MAITLHLCGVRTPCLTFSKETFLFRPLQPLHFAVSSFPCVSCQCLLLNNSRGMLALRFPWEAGKVDLLDGHDFEDRDFEQTVAKGLTCVMKFGGSSVASADRMREVADLILSFPEERPAIVLSATGKQPTSSYWLEKKQSVVGSQMYPTLKN